MHGGVVALPGSGVAHTKTAIDSHSKLTHSLSKFKEARRMQWNCVESPVASSHHWFSVYSVVALQSFTVFYIPSSLIVAAATSYRRTTCFLLPAACCLLLGSAPGWHTLLAPGFIHYSGII
jgi:hypothetical protein